METVLSESKVGSSILKQLTEINNKNSENLKNAKINLKKKEEKIVSKRNVISAEEYQSNINEFKLEVENYNVVRNKKINDFNKLKINVTNKFINLINPIIAKYAEKNSISIVLQKKDLVIGKSELDITGEIIKIINNEVNEFEVK